MLNLRSEKYTMFLLHSLQSPINIGMILRTAEVFGHGVTIFDAHGVMCGSKLDTVADFGCGSFGRRPPFVSRDLEACLDRVAGRIIATSAEASATPVSGFAWKTQDCIVLGNEYDGIPAEVLERAEETVWVPVPRKHLPKPKSKSPIDATRGRGVANDGSVSLNVAATAAVIAHSIFQAVPEG